MRSFGLSSRVWFQARGFAVYARGGVVGARGFLVLRSFRSTNILWIFLSHAYEEGILQRGVAPLACCLSLMLHPFSQLNLPEQAASCGESRRCLFRPGNPGHLPFCFRASTRRIA